MALNSVTTAKGTSSLELHALLRKTRQCAALTRVMRSRLGGATISEEERELVDLSSDLGTLVYQDLLNRPSSLGSLAAFEVAGKLSATLESLSEANGRLSTAPDDEQRLVLVTRIGWLQNSADDLAEELVGLVEDFCAGE